MKSSSKKKLTAKLTAALATRSRFSDKAVKDLSAALNALLADVFALFLKTKNFHWHMSGPHFRDYHLMLDDQSDQLLEITDELAERVRKIGGTTLRSIGHISRLQRISDNDEDFVDADGIIAELREDNLALAARMAAAHDLCDDEGDVVTTSLLENWLNDTEKRAWFLFEISRRGPAAE